MSATLVALVLSLLSAVAYAVAAVAQERLAARTRESDTGTLRLLGSGAWWGSVALNASAALLHVVALKYGSLTLVQPLGALTLVAAVPLGARLAGRRVSRVEWRGTGLTLLGLGALLLTTSGPAPDDTLSSGEAVSVAAVTMLLIAVLSRPGTRPGLRHASASGVASGVASALTQTVTVAVTDHSGPLLDVRVIVVALLVAAFAVGGLLLSQTAYRGGLGAPLAVVTLANPIAAAVIGLSLLGERFQGGLDGVLLALAGGATAAWGVVILARHAGALPPVASAAEPTAGGHADTAAGAAVGGDADTAAGAAGGYGSDEDHASAGGRATVGACASAGGRASAAAYASAGDQDHVRGGHLASAGDRTVAGGQVLDTDPASARAHALGSDPAAEHPDRHLRLGRWPRLSRSSRPGQRRRRPAPRSGQARLGR